MAEGRPTKLTSELQSRIVQAIQAGNYIETAAAYVGISKNTLFLWRPCSAAIRCPWT